MLALKPDLVEAHHNLGLVLRALGQLDAAAASFEAAIALRPSLFEAHVSLGLVLEANGDLAGASTSLGRALALRPGHAAGHYNLGVVLARQGRSDEAIDAYRHAIVLRPDFAEAHTNLGAALQGRGMLEAAEGAYRQAAALNPNSPAVHMNLAKVLQLQGRVIEAMSEFERVAQLRPDDAEARDAWLCGLNYRPDISPETLLAEHRRWTPQPAPSHATVWPNSPEPERRLRIGYVSGDFHDHPVGFFLPPVLGARDPARVEVFCYSNDERVDDTTRRLRAAADHWREITGVADTAVAAMIGEDQIDILVDLSGHTPANRLSLFAGRPAPLQVSWLGYAATTGLAAIDYLVMDAVTAPPGVEAWCSEALVRLPFGRFCYGPPAGAPAPAAPPSIERGQVSFGSFNNLAKIGPEVAALWAAVLRAVPGSRLVLKWQSLGDAGVQRRAHELFINAGIQFNALELRGFSLHTEMLAQYGDIDIALDPFPFGGGLTSCEALWMGVPVVTWPQDRFASRQTLGFLRGLSLDDLAAGSAEDYVAIAAGLAADVARRGELRATLRSRMTASPLCDAATFTPTLEAAYRVMWRRWCGGQPATAFDITSTGE